MKADDKVTLRLALDTRDVCRALRYDNSESIRPILMQLNGKERHVVISLAFKQLLKDVTTPNLDKKFIKRVRDEQGILSKIRSEVVAEQRELFRIDKLDGYEKYQHSCAARGKDPWDKDTWLANTCTTPSLNTG